MRTVLSSVAALGCLLSPMAAGQAHAAPMATTRTPGGDVPAACVHEVANGALIVPGSSADTVRAADGQHTVNHCAGGGIAHHAGVARQGVAADDDAAIPDGWQIDASYHTSRPVAYMHATFSVPQFPQGGYQNQIDYLFPALVTADDSTILQPVLDYGAFGQANWEMTAWYGGANGMFHTSPITIAPGDVLYGSMFRGCTGTACSWTITLTDRTTHQSTSIRTTDDVTVNWVFPAALEAYRATACSLLPGSGTTFHDVWVADANGREMAPDNYTNDYPANHACGEQVLQNTRARSVTLLNDPA